MKSFLVYWGLVSMLGIVHVHALLKLSSWEIPIYISCLLVIVIMYFFYKKTFIQVSNLGIRMNGLLLVMQLLLLPIYIIIKPSFIYLIPFLLFIVIEIVRQEHTKKVAELLEEAKRFEEERAHFNETFRVVRSERHDFLKHVSAIHFMLEKEQNREAKAYLDDLVDGYKETNLSIKGEKGMVAGILHQMYRRAQEAGISVVYDLDLPLSTLPLSDKEIVTLIGNLLSNSLDACVEWQNEHNEQALLSLQFYKRSGLYLLICKNHSNPIPTSILDSLFETFGKTTKTGEHEGLGTKLIHDVIKEHHGFLDFVYKEEEFTVKIKIPAIR
ncbi:sensor histidine kinase [Peribacillus huizhouensis]|uniref:LytT family two-component system sensor histidine kinase NatK n=1 Tax=Peribacillus huizhouensis TaxID=1501239 RepID=A0ABR6CNJ0_9BACI|nr:GHKL domain-containing protein [Peribacillus huizhouensis]MBA9026609.1 LytT family two-component system sensor histidine kinase NatK [Peribacillus huizhouensis]